MDQVKQFVNWDPFMQYCKENKISVALTEFGGHPTKRCNDWLQGFLQMMQDDAYTEEKGYGVIMWQLWRVCPHTSWYAGVNVQNPNADCVQFAAPQPADPEQYGSLWRVTSDPSVQYSMKNGIKKFVQK